MTSLDELLEAGRSRGYVLFDEIDALMPPDCDEDMEAPRIFAALARANIEIRADTYGVPVRAPISEDVDDPVEVYLREICAVPELDSASEATVLACIAGGDADGELAVKDLLESKLKMVAAVAQGYQPSDLHILDLIQEGNAALLRAVTSFDATPGYSFSAYAHWRVRRAISHVAAPTLL